MASRLATKVLLVAWDGADSRVIQPLLDAGQMPWLESIINDGVMGHLATLQPQVSPILWASLATGKRADKHGILAFVEPDPAGAGIRPIDSRARTCKAIWNLLTQSGIRSHVVGWPAHPADPIHGVFVTHLFSRVVAAREAPWPLTPGSVRPWELAEVLAPQRIHPAELSYAHLLPFVPQAAKVDQRRDGRLAGMATMLAECSTVHAVATWLMEHEPWEFMAVHYDAIDRFGHVFMPFHPPYWADVPAADFERYQEVMNGIYRYSDMMLGRLLQLAGPDTTVVLVSDHGFHSDRLRPRSPAGGRGAVNWHREHGIFAMRGPQIRKDEWLWGASLLDVTPTLLVLFGLPVGGDMDGRPLLQAFDAAIAADRIPSWDTTAGECGRLPPHDQPDPLEISVELERLVEQGYLELDRLRGASAAPQAADDRMFNLAQVYLESGDAGRAASLLQDLHDRHPDDDRFALHLARCRQDLGELAECQRLVQGIVGRGMPPLSAHVMLSAVCYSEGDYAGALEHLFQAEQSEPGRPALHCQIGEVYLKLRRWEEAERAFTKALDLDADSAHAYHGLAITYLARQRNQEAADAALTAIGLTYQLPMAHYHLGIALARMGNARRAIQAFETCLAQRPKTAPGHRWLSALYERAMGDAERAASHRRHAEALEGNDPSAGHRVEGYP